MNIKVIKGIKSKFCCMQTSIFQRTVHYTTILKVLQIISDFLVYMNKRRIVYRSIQLDTSIVGYMSINISINVKDDRFSLCCE